MVVKKYVRRPLNVLRHLTYWGEDVIKSKCVEYLTEAFVCCCFLATSSSLCNADPSSSPFQEVFLRRERQSGGGRVVQRHDGDRRSAQQRHTNKSHREQSMMGRGEKHTHPPPPTPQPAQNISTLRNTAGVFWFSPVPLAAYSYTHTHTLVDWFERRTTVLSLLGFSFMFCSI